jgi:hypothetical protein
VRVPARGLLVDRRLLAQVGFTNHAVERFAQRAGLDTTRRAEVEPIMRDLLLQEGRVVRERPKWARSRNEADLYLQAGEWLLFVCRGSTRRGGAFSVVTVLNGPAGMTWEKALARELVFTPRPVRAARPRRRRARWSESVAAGLAGRSERAEGERAGVVGAIVRAHRDRRRALAAEHRAAVAAFETARLRHRDERVRAREAHLRRYGLTG